MSKMIEIYVTVPTQPKLKILVPQQLFEEFGKMVKEENLSLCITEALTEQLKKIRFRTDLEKVSNKTCGNKVSSKIA